MRFLLFSAVIAFVTACTIGGTEVDCDEITDDTACSCPDGSEGAVRCTQAFVKCVCPDEDDEWANMVPIDPNQIDLDAGSDADTPDAADTGDTSDTTNDADFPDTTDTGDTGDTSPDAADTGDTGDTSPDATDTEH